MSMGVACSCTLGPEALDSARAGEGVEAVFEVEAIGLAHTGLYIWTEVGVCTIVGSATGLNAAAWGGVATECGTSYDNAHAGEEVPSCGRATGCGIEASVLA